MAILNFMPQFVPWSTKALLKKKDDPDVAAATESTTGFFGDTFDFIDDAFDWTATAVEEPAIQYEEPPQYFEAPVAPPEPFYDVPPQYYDEPVQDTGFGSAIGDIFNGSGEGLGFDFIGEPTDSWASQAPFEVPQADYNWDGGMGFEPAYVPPEPPTGIGDAVGNAFDSWTWDDAFTQRPGIDFSNTDPQPYTPPPSWMSTNNLQYDNPPLMPQGEQQPWMNFDFPDFGSTLMDWADPAPRYEDAVPMENPSAISSGIMDFPEPDPMGWNDISSMFNVARPEPTPAPQTWDIPGMENPNTAIPGWFSMTPDERGEYVWQSGLPAESYLTDEDIAVMSDEVRFKLDFAENERGNISSGDWLKNIGQGVWDVTQGAMNQSAQLGMDAFYDPIAGQINPAGLSSLRPNAQGGLSQLNVPEQQVMLDDTIQNVQDASNPWDFLVQQDADYQDRPFSEQLMGQVFVPGNGLFGSVDDLPRGLAALEKGADLIQGGPLLSALGNIPGASTALKQVILPGAVGAGGGLATEAIFDPTYTDQWGNGYDPGYAEMGLAGFGLGVGTKAATSAGTTPYGAGIKDVMKNFPVVSGTSKWGLPNQVKGDPGVNIEWEDPLDKALYQATSKSSAKTKPAVIALLKQHGISQSEINAAGEQIRARIAGIIDELSPKQGDTILVEPVARAVVDEIPTVPTPIRQAATVDIPTVPSAITETPQERLVRLQQEVFASDPTAATPFSAPGAISPSVADEIPTVPTGIADEVVTPAPSTSLVERAVNHVDAILKERDLEGEAKRAAFAKWKSNLKENLDREYPNDPRRALDEWYAQTTGVTLETYASKTHGLTEEEGRELFNIAAKKARGMGYGTAFTDPAIDKAIKSLVNGTNADPRQLRILRNVLTDTPYQKATDDAIETIAPKAKPTRAKPKVITNGDMAREAAEAEARAGGIVEPDEVRRIGNTAVARLGPDATKPVADVIEPGMEKPIGETIDEIGTAKLTPEDKAVIGADDELFPDIEDNNDWWQKAEDEYVPRNDGSGGDLPPIDDVGSGGEFQDTNDWWRGVTEKDAPSTGPKPEWKVLADDIADWRADNFKGFDAIDINAKSSWAQRKVGGALKNKLADTLTSRGRDLDMYLQAQGRTFEESKDMVERELADYLNARMMREAKNGNKNALLDHALTALHMGDFQPKMDGVKVTTGTGQVPGALQTARTANAALKNMFFGIADVGAIMGNAVPAIMNQGPMVGLAYLNRIAKLVDIDDALRNRQFSGLAMDQSQDVMTEDVGTLIGWAGRAMGDKPGGAALRAIDRPFTKWNEVLSKAQFDLLMNKGLRQPAYEGNLVLLKLLGRDVNDPTLQRAAARMANAATSTAPLARGNTRRAAEGATLSSARYLRAQGDLLLAATKLINPKASLNERIIAASAIASVIAVSAAANELAGNRLDLNPFKGVNVNPLKGDIDITGAEFNPDFGKITLPDGTVVPFFRQKELAQTLLKTVAELDDLVKKDPTGIRDAWSRFIIGRTGPLGGTALKGLAKTGYDPVENTYSFPWEGEGFGNGMSPTQYALQMLPVPVGITGLLNSDGTPLSKGLNFIGGGTYPQGDYSAALKKYGVDSMEEFEKLDPDTFMTRKEKLYQENPELRAKFADTASTKIAESKVANSEKFMEAKQMVGDWRETKDDLSNQAKGAYSELGLEEKERPSTPGSAQWIWDYNNTFKLALEDPDNSSSEMNDEILGKLQADFWAKHPDPKVRKEILQYQILRAPTEADKMYARDMARLNGFDPDTGETLKIPGTDQPMPNYFNMDRYFWTEVPNDEAKQFDTKFNKWKLKQSDKVRDLTRAKQIDLYLATEDEASTRFNGKEWTPAAIKDVKNYGLPSKEDPIYSEYKQIMLPELLWFKPEQYWDNIKEAHDNRE